MKNVRIFYTKRGRMRFVSHLDMTRFMTRMLRRAGLPVWYTEGFHPHLYLTFALPLSLGFESEYEIMDFRLENDEFPLDTICDRLNSVFPPYIHAFKAAEPINKTGKIAAARFKIQFSDSGKLQTDLKDFLELPEIICTKTTKRGNEKQIDIASKISDTAVSEDNGNTTLLLTLPAGGEDNVNPELLLNAFFEHIKSGGISYRINRTALFTSDGGLFV